MVRIFHNKFHTRGLHPYITVQFRASVYVLTSERNLIILMRGVVLNPYSALSRSIIYVPLRVRISVRELAVTREDYVAIS